MKKIANKFKSIRKQMNLSITGVAKLSKLTPAYISRLEAGEYESLSIKTCQALALGLGMTLKNFLHELGVLEDKTDYTEMISHALRSAGFDIVQIERILIYVEFVKKLEDKVVRFSNKK